MERSADRATERRGLGHKRLHRNTERTAFGLFAACRIELNFVRMVIVATARLEAGNPLEIRRGGVVVAATVATRGRVAVQIDTGTGQRRHSRPARRQKIDGGAEKSYQSSQKHRCVR